MKLALEHYTPAEAVEITGLEQTTVRNWRRAGYLARHKGTARYDIVELLKQVAMQVMVARSIFPQDAAAFAPEVARAVFQSLLHSDEAVSPGVHAAAREATSGVPAELTEIVGDIAQVPVTTEDMAALRARSRIEDAITRHFGITGVKRPEWLVIWATGELEFLYDENLEDSILAGHAYFGDPRLQGAVVMLCLGALARMVLERLPRPPIKLEEDV